MTTIDPRSTVFISYRHNPTSDLIVHSIFHELKDLGYSVLYDRKSLRAGEFPNRLEEFIDASGHFILVLAEDTFDRCRSRKDWVRLEIERAMHSRPYINVVPLFLPNFRFDMPRVENAFGASGKYVKQIKTYNGVHFVNMDQLQGTIENLCSFFSSFSVNTNFRKPLTIPQPTPPPKPTESDRRADDFMLAASVKFNADDFYGAIDECNEALKLLPNAVTYNLRGRAYALLHDYDRAMYDYRRAIFYDRHYPYTYNNMGVIQFEQGKYELAWKDFSIAIAIDNYFSRPHFHRANLAREMGDLQKALLDYERYLRLGGGEQYDNEDDVNSIIESIIDELAKENIDVSSFDEDELQTFDKGDTYLDPNDDVYDDIEDLEDLMDERNAKDDL